MNNSMEIATTAERFKLSDQAHNVTIAPATERVELAQGIIQEISRERVSQTTEPLTLRKGVHFVARLSDRTGQSLITLTLFSLAFVWELGFSYLIVPVTAATIILRCLIESQFKPNNILSHRRVRTGVVETFIEEFLIGLAFLSLGAITEWPLSLDTVALFITANILAQVVATLVFTEAIGKRTKATAVWAEAELQKAIIIGTGRSALSLADSIVDHPELATQVVGFVDYKRTGLWRYRDIPLIGHPDQLHTLVGGRQLDQLLIAVEPEQIPLTRDLFIQAETMGIPISLITDWYDTPVAKPQGDRIGQLPAVRFHSAPSDNVRLILKSALDRFLATLGLILISPIMLLTASIIKLESRGPVFFKQIRSGRNGQPFPIFKFRTMEVDAEKKKSKLMDQNEMSGPVFKIAADPRITKVGHYLRKYSIDELPQLINVIRGEMSLVGPRPPLPKEVAGMKPWQRRKLSVKPGVTCTWQVNGRNAIDFEEWMRLDLEYIDEWSLTNDLKLIARTIPAVLKGSGS